MCPISEIEESISETQRWLKGQIDVAQVRYNCINQSGIRKRNILVCASSTDQTKLQPHNLEWVLPYLNSKYLNTEVRLLRTTNGLTTGCLVAHAGLSLVFFVFELNVPLLYKSHMSQPGQRLIILLTGLSVPQYRPATCCVRVPIIDWLLTESLSGIQSSSLKLVW